MRRYNVKSSTSWNEALREPRIYVIIRLREEKRKEKRGGIYFLRAQMRDRVIDKYKRIVTLYLKSRGKGRGELGVFLAFGSYGYIVRGMKN